MFNLSCFISCIILVIVLCVFFVFVLVYFKNYNSAICLIYNFTYIVDRQFKKKKFNLILLKCWNIFTTLKKMFSCIYEFSYKIQYFKLIVFPKSFAILLYICIALKIHLNFPFECTKVHTYYKHRCQMYDELFFLKKSLIYCFYFSSFFLWSNVGFLNRVWLLEK